MPEEELDGAALLAAAMGLAADAHTGGVDRAGQPYLAHPLRVAARLAGHGEHAVAAGLLHDTVEDSGQTLEGLRAAGIPEAVCEAVDALTKRDGEPYEQAVERAAAHPLAAAVKAADIADNTDPARLALLDAPTRQRLEDKYTAALHHLEAHTP